MRTRMYERDAALAAVRRLLDIEFTGQAPDDDHRRPGAWLELRAEDPAAVMRAALDAGLTEVKHPGR